MRSFYHKRTRMNDGSYYEQYYTPGEYAARKFLKVLMWVVIGFLFIHFASLHPELLEERASEFSGVTNSESGIESKVQNSEAMNSEVEYSKSGIELQIQDSGVVNSEEESHESGIESQIQNSEAMNSEVEYSESGIELQIQDSGVVNSEEESHESGIEPRVQDSGSMNSEEESSDSGIKPQAQDSEAVNSFLEKYKPRIESPAQSGIRTFLVNGGVLILSLLVGVVAVVFGIVLIKLLFLLGEWIDVNTLAPELVSVAIPSGVFILYVVLCINLILRIWSMTR